VDTTSRWGGDEFLVLLPETDLEGARTAAAKLKEAIALIPLAVAGGTMSLSISAGAAVARTGQTVDAVIAEADKDMYCSRGRPAS
jgi:diguanylate cyclase (GGDEF)-like protein